MSIHTLSLRTYEVFRFRFVSTVPPFPPFICTSVDHYGTLASLNIGTYSSANRNQRGVLVALLSDYFVCSCPLYFDNHLIKTNSTTSSDD
jgi:hypothetical protein